MGKRQQGPAGKYIFGTATVGEKGQIVIPKKARDQYGVKPGDDMIILGDELGIAMLKSDRFLHLVQLATSAFDGEDEGE